MQNVPNQALKKSASSGVGWISTLHGSNIISAHEYSFYLNKLSELSMRGLHDALNAFLRKRHSVSTLVVHLIITTKYRRKLFVRYMTEQLWVALVLPQQSLNANSCE